MATVHTPGGETLSGVTGVELDYYRGEANTQPGYEIVEDASLPSDVTFPQVFEDGVRVELPEAPAVQPQPEQVALSDVSSAIDELAQAGASAQAAGAELQAATSSVNTEADAGTAADDSSDSPKPRR